MFMHVFTNSESSNQQILFTIFFLSSKTAKNVYSHKKIHFAAALKENKTFFEKKSWIRRFGIRENMSRATY